MMVLPIVPVAMLTTFVTGVVGVVSLQLAALLGVLAQLPLTYIILTATWFAQLPFSAIVIPQISVWFMLGMYIVPTGLYAMWLYRKRVQVERGPLFDWVIVEEVENKTDVGSDDPTSVEVPVFFR
jgi:hypothetical protein